MKMKPFTFGMKTLRVTQNYNSSYSHRPHWDKSKDFADYPIDLGGENGGRSPYYAPVDMKVTAIKGQGNKMTNTIWLVATEKCLTPSGEMTPFIMLTHWNDSDRNIHNLKVGSIVKAGQPICEEGVDGATANHLHAVFGNADKGVGNDIIENSNGKWVSNGYCMKPEEVVFIDKEFTDVADTGGINFLDKPIEIPTEEPVVEVDPFPGISDEELAERARDGEFGNGEDRQKALGIRYDSVQALVNILVKEEKEKVNEIKEGDTVIVNGVGTASSDGSGEKTINYKNTEMKVIGISNNKNRPNAYALNARNRGKVHDWTAVTAWFSKDSISK